MTTTAAGAVNPAKTLLAIVLVLAVLTLAPVSGLAQDEGDAGTVTLSADASPWELSVALSQATFADDGAADVVIARDDRFADALASGGLQSRRPLLLVPPAGPLPGGVLTELERLGVTQALLLGGEAALGEEIATELQDVRVAVRRLAGAERLATAVAVSGELPDATTAVLARAYGDEQDPSRGFADALAAGGLAAENEWPVLLTAADELSTSSEARIADGIEHVKIVGGTLAVSAAVEQRLIDMGVEVERVAGSNRFGTAVEIAKTRGDDANAARGILLDGTASDAWRAGFAAAARSAALDAPIVLAAQTQLPEETREWLAAEVAEASTDGDDEILTCVVEATTCEEGRRAADLPADPIITVSPADSAVVDGGQVVTITIDPADQVAGQDVSLSVCGTDGNPGTAVTATADASGTVAVQLPDTIPEPCEMRASASLSGGGEGTLAWDLNPRPDDPVYSLRFRGEADATQFPEPFRVDFGTGVADREGEGGLGDSFATYIAATPRDTVLLAVETVGPPGLELFGVETVVGSVTVTPQEGVALDSWAIVVRTRNGETVLERGTEADITFDPLELDPDVLDYELDLEFSPVDGPPPSATPVDLGGGGDFVRITFDAPVDCPPDSIVFEDEDSYNVLDGTVCTASAPEGRRLVVVQPGTPIALERAVEITADGTRGPISIISFPE